MENENSNIQRLEDRIKQLELERKATLLELKQELSEAGESIKPANLIKNSIEEITESKHFKKLLIAGALGLGATLVASRVLSKKGEKRQPLSRFILQTVLTIALSNQFVSLRNAGMNALQDFALSVLKKKEDEPEDENEERYSRAEK